MLVGCIQLQAFLSFLCRSGDQLRTAFDWVFRLAKPQLYFKGDSPIAELLKLCPVLYQHYAPPLVSLNGGMHMVLSVGAYTHSM